MSNIVDWSSDYNSTRKELLKLPKPKLIKLCKNKKTSFNGTKNDIIERLLKHAKVKPNKKSKKLKSKKSKNKQKKVKSNNKTTHKKQLQDTTKTKHIKPEPVTKNTSPFPVPPPLKTLTQQCSEHELSDWLYDDEAPYTLIIDNGSFWTKAGFAGDLTARSVFPTVVTLPHICCQGVMVGMAQKDHYIGDEAISKRGRYRLKYPVQSGVISLDSYNDDLAPLMEKLWHHTFYNELRIQPEEHPLLLTEMALNRRKQREMTTQIMFERFNFPCMYIANQSVMSLFGVGKTTGIVLESGADITRSVPVYEGHCLKYAVNTLGYGGRTVTDNLMRLLQSNGYSFTTSAEREIVRDIKEKLCYVSIDENEKDVISKYELPDGQMIDISSEKYKCAEILFTPNIINNLRDELGIHELIYKSVKECDIGIQYELFNNILCSGGNLMFRGIEDRLLNEMQRFGCNNNHILVDGYLRENCWRNNNHKLLYKDIIGLMYKYSPSQCNIIKTDKNKMYLPWIGASIFATNSMFLNLCITYQEYQEIGASIVHRKCF